MYKYAQIDDAGRCVAVSDLSGVVDIPHMIALSIEDDVQPGDIFGNGVWTRPDPLPQPDPEPSAQERIDQLESQNLMLMEAVADLYEMMLGAG
ncbi:hypothetical protein [Paenibacillus sp. IITD108]|uniref:hypothetical protein n=1 Tax=Paenibacillus sp. IITD108 TaxID=3116649 RepID=UPI002F410477